MAKTYTPFKFYKLKLYQQIMFLVFFILLIVLSLNIFLVQKQMIMVTNKFLGNNADVVTQTLANSPMLIQHLQEKPISEKAISGVVKSISEATRASIIVFDSKENIVSIFNPTTHNLLDDSNLNLDTISALQKLPVNMFQSKHIRPILNAQGTLLGYVLVGFPEADKKEITAWVTNILIIGSALGLGVGLVGALMLAYAVKKTLFGFEPVEISQLLEERTTLLNTVNESIFVTDPEFKLRLLNTKAQELVQKVGFTLPAFPQDENFSKLASTSLLKEALTSGKDLKNIELNINGLATIGDIIVLKHKQTITGLLVSINEKDSVQAMAERLSGITNYADALRAKTHEFMNKMHVIKGLLYTKDYEELKEYIETITEDDNLATKDITDKIKNSLLASFLIAKKSRAHELQINFTLSEESSFPEALDQILSINDLIIIIGNLLENAFDVLKAKSGERVVLLDILPYEDELILIVANNGEPISQTQVAKIFQKGYTTKGKGHGYGLALLKERVEKLHGNITVDSDELNGTEFTVQIPLEGDLKYD